VQVVKKTITILMFLLIAAALAIAKKTQTEEPQATQL
jgi:hypothetical protein